MIWIGCLIKYVRTADQLAGNVIRAIFFEANTLGCEFHFFF